MMSGMRCLLVVSCGTQSQWHAVVLRSRLLVDLSLLDIPYYYVHTLTTRGLPDDTTHWRIPLPTMVLSQPATLPLATS